MSRIVVVRGHGFDSYAGLERDDGVTVLPSIFASPDGNDTEIEGKRYRFVRRSAFAAEVAAAGLQPVWLGA